MSEDRKIERTAEVEAGAAGASSVDEPGQQDSSSTFTRRDVLRYGAFGTAGAALGLAGLKRGAQYPMGAEREAMPRRRSFSTHSPVTLTLWVWAGAAIAANEFEAVKKTAPKELGHVSLNVKTASDGGDQGVAEKVSLALSGHQTLPDIVTLNYIEVPEFAVKGVLSNADSYFKPVEKELYAGAKTVATVNGSYVAFPEQLKAKLFYYREDLFESAGIDPSTFSNMTKSEFLAMGKKFTAKHPGKYIMNMGNEPPEYLFDEILSAYAPLSFANKSGKYDITSNPAFEDTLSFMRDIYTSGIAYPIVDFSTDWPAAIKAEKICGFLIADWMDEFLPQYATLSAFGKWKAVPWPILAPLANQRYGSDSGGSVHVVLSGTPNASLALDVLNQWHLSKKGSLAAFSASGDLPILQTLADDVISSLKSQKKPSSMSETTWKELPQNYFGSSYIKTKLEVQSYVKTFGFDPKALVDWETIMVDWMYKAVQGKANVKAALKGMQTDMESQVGNPWSAT